MVGINRILKFCEYFLIKVSNTLKSKMPRRIKTYPEIKQKLSKYLAGDLKFRPKFGVHTSNLKTLITINSHSKF